MLTNLERVGVRMIALVHCDENGNLGRLSMTERFKRLRHHSIIGRDHKKRNWLWIGGGAGGGAAIGALAGGGTGALIGGPVGAGAGTTVALLTGKKDIKLAPETPVTFKLADPVTVKVKG